MKRYIVNIDDKSFMVDEASGEAVQINPDQHIAVVMKRKQKRRGSFIIASSENLFGLAKLNLPGEAWKVLIAVLAGMEFENVLLRSHADLADQVGITKQQFSRSLKRLLDEGIVYWDFTKGKKLLVVDPSIAFKGSVENQSRRITEKLKGEINPEDPSNQEPPLKRPCGKLINGGEQYCSPEENCAACESELEELQSYFDEFSNENKRGI